MKDTNLQDTVNNLGKASEKLMDAICELGLTIVELAEEIYKNILEAYKKISQRELYAKGIIDLKLLEWKISYTSARGRKRARLKRKIKKREQRYKNIMQP